MRMILVSRAVRLRECPLRELRLYAESKNRRGKSASWKSDRDGNVLWISDLARCAKKT